MTALQAELDRSALQLAMYQNRIDAIESGTAKWEDLDLVARAGYLTEAKRSIGALLALGWRPANVDAHKVALAEAVAACEQQTVLASLVAGRPTDFEKGVLSCIAAIQALAAEPT